MGRNLTIAAYCVISVTPILIIVTAIVGSKSKSVWKYFLIPIGVIPPAVIAAAFGWIPFLMLTLLFDQLVFIIAAILAAAFSLLLLDKGRLRLLLALAVAVLCVLFVLPIYGHSGWSNYHFHNIWVRHVH